MIFINMQKSEEGWNDTEEVASANPIGGDFLFCFAISVVREIEHLLTLPTWPTPSIPRKPQSEYIGSTFTEILTITNYYFVWFIFLTKVQFF